MKIKLMLKELSPFKHSYAGQLSCAIGYGAFLHYRVWILCNKLLQFSTDCFQTLYTCTCWDHIADEHVSF